MLDRSSATPLHMQLEDIIRAKLSNHEWPPQHKIPTESELCATYGLSRGTVRSVISRLVFEGLFERIPGKGTFVKDSKITILSSSDSSTYLGIRKQLEESGYKMKTELVSLHRTMINHAISRRFNGKPDDEFFVIECTRSVNEIPLICTLSYIPCALCPDLDAHYSVDEDDAKLMESLYGLRPARVEESLESIPAGKPCAETLHVNVGYPLLLLEDMVYSEDGTPFEYSLITFRGDRIRVKVSV